MTLAEWLAADPKRYVILRSGEFVTPDGDMAYPDTVKFDLATRLQDGRTAVCSVRMQGNLLTEPVISRHVVHEAELALASLLSGQAGSGGVE